MLQDEAGAWRFILLFSAPWEGLPSQGKLHQERCYSQVTSGGNERANEHRVETWGILRATGLQRKQHHHRLSQRGFCPELHCDQGSDSAAGGNDSHCASLLPGQALARGRHPRPPHLQGGPVGSDGTEERPRLPLEIVAGRVISLQAADFAFLISSPVAGRSHSQADRAHASSPNNQPVEVVSKPEKRQGASAEEGLRRCGAKGQTAVTCHKNK